ncbi:unnamed protein product [Dovyalis caffra]|uniref:Uncharacterized protein n=1 Tax=Dovyalis caffra TaxID=77055 RepID=A0AAV1RJ21_9ROSI|nr:unnamed protein product [Dovyalis caffra]
MVERLADAKDDDFKCGVLIFEDGESNKVASAVNYYWNYYYDTRQGLEGDQHNIIEENEDLSGNVDEGNSADNDEMDR